MESGTFGCLPTICWHYHWAAGWSRLNILNPVLHRCMRCGLGVVWLWQM
jgi:hypothetical protein